MTADQRAAELAAQVIGLETRLEIAENTFVRGPIRQCEFKGWHRNGTQKMKAKFMVVVEAGTVGNQFTYTVLDLPSPGYEGPVKDVRVLEFKEALPDWELD